MLYQIKLPMVASNLFKTLCDSEDSRLFKREAKQWQNVIKTIVIKKEVLFSVVYFAVCVFPKLDEIERVGFEPTYISI